jgi:catechol 2,3-dioxygenase
VSRPCIKPLGIDHAAISVHDLQRSVEFYTSVLGLKLTTREYLKPGIEYFLDCGNQLIGLIQGDPEQGMHLLAEGGIGANHVSFRVHARDFDEAVETLKNNQVKIAFMKKREKSWSVYFYDPDGNKLEITAWPDEDKA